MLRQRLEKKNSKSYEKTGYTFPPFCFLKEKSAEALTKEGLIFLYRVFCGKNR